MSEPSSTTPSSDTSTQTVVEPQGQPPVITTDHEPDADDGQTIEPGTLSKKERRQRALNVLEGKTPEGKPAEPAADPKKPVVRKAEIKEVKKEKEEPAAKEPPAKDPSHAEQKAQLAKQAREVTRNVRKVESEREALKAEREAFEAEKRRFEEDLIGYGEEHFAKKGANFKQALIEHAKKKAGQPSEPKVPAKEPPVNADGSPPAAKKLPREIEEDPEFQEFQKHKREKEGREAANREVQRHLAHIQANPVDPTTHPELAEFSDEFIAKEMLNFAIDDYNDHRAAGGTAKDYVPLDTDELRDKIEEYYKAERTYRESGKRNRQVSAENADPGHEPAGQTRQREPSRATKSDVSSRGRGQVRTPPADKPEERRSKYLDMVSGN